MIKMDIEVLFMKYITLFFTILLFSTPVGAQELALTPLSAKLYSFSPLGQVYNKHLGLYDANSNGTIDRGAGEGYETFIGKYGDADTGFAANGVIFGAANGHLEEPEIVNHYYVHIRFKNIDETKNIERDIAAGIRGGDIPLVWLDDEQGTVMTAVNRILGEGWQNKAVTADGAEILYRQVLDGLGTRGLPGNPNQTGYYQLPEFINRKAGYCFEVAQFGFWFFSQLKMHSVVVETALTPALVHGVVKLIGENKIIDYFGTGNRYRVRIDQWAISTPVQAVGDFYAAQARKGQSTENAEQALIYDKYSIPNMAHLLELYAGSGNRNHHEIITLGEFILQNSDIPGMMNSSRLNIDSIKSNFEFILSILIESYNATGNRTGFTTAERLLNQYYGNDPHVKPFLDYYRL
jgi:hypothetical protein